MSTTMSLRGLALFSLCCRFVAGDDYGFVYPNATESADGPVSILLGETMNIQWNAPFPAISLAFIPEHGDVFTFFDRRLSRSCPIPTSPGSSLG
jgi:hypothetical protein